MLNLPGAVHPRQFNDSNPVSVTQGYSTLETCPDYTNSPDYSSQSTRNAYNHQQSPYQPLMSQSNILSGTAEFNTTSMRQPTQLEQIKRWNRSIEEIKNEIDVFRNYGSVEDLSALEISHSLHQEAYEGLETVVHAENLIIKQFGPRLVYLKSRQNEHLFDEIVDYKEQNPTSTVDDALELFGI